MLEALTPYLSPRRGTGARSAGAGSLAAVVEWASSDVPSKGATQPELDKFEDKPCQRLQKFVQGSLLIYSAFGVFLDLAKD